MPKLIDIAGRNFGRLTVLNSVGGKWLCQCDCGNTKLVRGPALRLGQVNSCGCLKKELEGTSTRTHGLSRTPEHRAWLAMKNRCNNPRGDKYEYYGGRGITVCDRWANSFETFLSDMGPRTSSKHSLDRIDVNGNYEPGNCRWATQLVQVRNTTSNIAAVIDGERVLITDASRKLGITRSSIKERIARGWSIERAFTEPRSDGGCTRFNSLQQQQIEAQKLK